MRSRGYRKLIQRAAACIAAFAIFLVSLVFVIGDAEVARAYMPGTGNGTFNGSSGTTAAAAVVDMALDTSGNVYVLTGSNVRKYSSAGTLLSTLAVGSSGTDLAVDNSGNIYVGFNGSLKKWSSAGSPDTTFNANVIKDLNSSGGAVLANSVIYEVGVQPSGGVIAASSAANALATSKSRERAMT